MPDSFQKVGMVRGSEIKGEGDSARAVIKIEIDGSTEEWSSFQTSLIKEVKVGEWFSFELSSPPKKDGRGNWHNVKKVLGPAQPPAPGSGPPPAALGGNHPLKTDVQHSRERLGIDRHGAVTAVVRLVEYGIPVDKLDQTVDVVLRIARKVEAHYRREENGYPPKAEEAKSKDPSRKSSTRAPTETPNGEASGFKNPGEFMTGMTSEFKGKTSQDILDQLHVDQATEIPNLKEAAATLRAAWKE